MLETSPLLISLNGICLRKKIALRFLLINFALNWVLEVNFVQPLLIALEVSCLGIREHMHSGKQSFLCCQFFHTILNLQTVFLICFNLAISTSYLRMLHFLYKYAVRLMLCNISCFANALEATIPFKLRIFNSCSHESYKITKYS